MRLISVILLFLILSCNTENTGDDLSAKVVKIDSILDNRYPTDIILEGNTLKIKMLIPTNAFFYKNNTILVRELSIYSIKDYLSDVDKIIFTCYNSIKLESKTLTESSLYLKSEINQLVSFNNSHVTAFDFKNYILNNINGDEQYNFYGVISAIYEMDGIKSEVIPDFVEIIMGYAKELEEGKSKHQNQILLKKIRTILLENPDLWKDFNLEDIDYFLNYKRSSISQQQ